MKTTEEFFGALSAYVDVLRHNLHRSWDQWGFDPSRSELHEVVGGMLARQVTLATQMALSPFIWNGHIAPIILRTMVDNYIAFAWILKDPLDRSKKFIAYGLGQEKLNLEYLKEHVKSEGKDPDSDPMVKARTAWIDSQRYHFLTDVDVGAWAGIAVRTMAEEADCLDIYRYAYTPFSAATHSMWHHIAKYNLILCENPLHRLHRVPVDGEVPIDPDYLYRAGKYVDEMFMLFASTFGVAIADKAPLDVLNEIFREFLDSGNSATDQDSGIDSTAPA